LADNVAVVTFGDGTSNRGEFHESINMAAVLHLPVVFVCQNNQYAVSTPFCRSMLCMSVADRAPGYGIPGAQVDGNDVEAVHLTVQEAVQKAREGKGPTLIEALTYRVLGHWVADPATYRSAQEVEEWKKKDPIDRLRKKLIAKGILNVLRVEEINKSMEKNLSVAIDEAEKDPWPDQQILGLNDVFAGGR